MRTTFQTLLTAGASPESMRRQGALRFAVVHGMLGWGVRTACVWMLVMALAQPLLAADSHPSALGNLMTGLKVFPLAGIAWGLFAWWWAVGRRRSQAPREA